MGCHSMARPLFSWRHAILESDLRPTTRLVLLTLSCHMSDAGDSCFPSTRKLARETGLSERSVISHIKIARQRGWITVGLHGFGGQKWRSHEYVCAVPEGAERGSAALPERAERVSVPSPKGAERVSPPLAEGAEPDDIKVLKEVQCNSRRELHREENSTVRARASANHHQEPAGNPVEPGGDRPDAEASHAKAKSRRAQAPPPADVREHVWRDFVAVRKAKRAPITDLAMQAIIREAKKAGMTLEQALVVCVERNWQGFRADWYDKAERPKDAGLIRQSEPSWLEQ